MKRRCFIAALCAATCACTVAACAEPVSLDGFVPVHKAQVEHEGANRIRVRFSSAEWGTGARWESKEGVGFSGARWIAADVENLSPARQARLAMSVSAGKASGDSADHASALTLKNRSVVTGIGLNPGEKGTMRLLLPHPSIYAAPDGARGPRVIDTSHVTSIHFMMQWPFEDEVPGLADIRISNLRLEGKPDLRRRVDPSKYCPFVDRYGQFMHMDWEQKVHSDNELAGDLSAELKSLKPVPRAWDRFGGWKDGPHLAATGHFRTEKVGGKWWLVTPDGTLFFSVGPDVTRVTTDITDGRRHPEWFATAVPPDGKMPFTVWNLEKKFGRKDFSAEYYGFVLKRLDSWGMNTLGCWSAKELAERSSKPYVMCVLERAKEVKRHSRFKIYDLAAPDFGDRMRAAIRRRFAEDASLAHAAKDEMCIGFFVDNELPFQTWISSVGDEAAAPLLDRYFRVCREEIARAAPGKMYLGCRFVGFRQRKVLWRSAARYCDVISVNAYANTVANLSGKIFDGCGERPLLVGEFHFGCLDRGMFQAGLVQVCDQRERGRSYERFVEGCLSHPLIVGCHWFQYRDQPLVGRGDGEAYQIGFVDVCDRPYRELCAAARSIGEAMYRIRASLGAHRKFSWSFSRERAFRSLAAHVNAKCYVFPHGVAPDERASRLAKWVDSLPCRTAVFAVNDYTAALTTTDTKFVPCGVEGEVAGDGVTFTLDRLETGIYRLVRKPPYDGIGISFK